MQLDEILQNNTISEIAKQTNISEDNLDALIAADFDRIKRVKTMGFISILEREYGADLSAMKKEAIEYYESHRTDESVTLGLPISEPKKGKSKLLMLITFVLIVYAIWYAYVNFDKKKFNAMLPFSEETVSKFINSDESIESRDASELSIDKINTEENRSN